MQTITFLNLSSPRTLFLHEARVGAEPVLAGDVGSVRMSCSGAPGPRSIKISTLPVKRALVLEGEDAGATVRGALV